MVICYGSRRSFADFLYVLMIAAFEDRQPCDKVRAMLRLRFVFPTSVLLMLFCAPRCHTEEAQNSPQMPLTFHQKRFYEDVDLAFRQRVMAGDSYTVSRILDSMIRGEDVLDNRLAAINQPTLVVWGREDKLIPLSFGERFHQEIKASRFCVIENCGHMPHVECPEKLNAVLLQFLGDR